MLKGNTETDSRTKTSLGNKLNGYEMNVRNMSNGNEWK